MPKKQIKTINFIPASALAEASKNLKQNLAKKELEALRKEINALKEENVELRQYLQNCQETLNRISEKESFYSPDNN